MLSYNLYAYVSNGPINAIDPSGYGLISVINLVKLIVYLAKPVIKVLVPIVTSQVKNDLKKSPVVSNGTGSGIGIGGTLGGSM